MNSFNLFPNCNQNRLIRLYNFAVMLSLVSYELIFFLKKSGYNAVDQFPLVVKTSLLDIVHFNYKRVRHLNPSCGCPVSG